MKLKVFSNFVDSMILVPTHLSVAFSCLTFSMPISLVLRFWKLDHGILTNLVEHCRSLSELYVTVFILVLLNTGRMISQYYFGAVKIPCHYPFQIPWEEGGSSTYH